jgi:hypothetical protein
MVVTYVGTYPYDPKLELKNFQQKQAEYAAAYLATSDPLVLREALLNAHGYLRLPADLDWWVTATGNFITKSRAKGKRTGRPSQTVERFQERMRHVQRYRCVRDLIQKNHTKECALDLAAKQLAAARPTIEDSYDLVNLDLDRKKNKSEYFLLVARSDPTRVPVQVNQTSDGVIINGAAISRRDR